MRVTPSDPRGFYRTSLDFLILDLDPKIFSVTFTFVLPSRCNVSVLGHSIEKLLRIIRFLLIVHFTRTTESKCSSNKPHIPESTQESLCPVF